MKMTRLLAVLLVGSTAFAGAPVFAQGAKGDTRTGTSCEELGALAAFTERCGGTRPKKRSINDQVKDMSDWTAALLDCAQSNIASFDDRVSDAATVATGLVAYCSATLPNYANSISPQDSDSIVGRVKPNVTAFVLHTRASNLDKKK
jgi:hypothetical protein